MSEQQELIELGQHRTKLHKGQESQRILAEGHDALGLFGQDAFSKRFGIPLNKADRIRGDNHDNFWLQTTKGRYGVKVATVHFHNTEYHGLLVESSTIKPNRIYVLAQYMETQPAKHGEIIKSAWLNGWAWGAVVLREGGPSRQWPLTVWNHQLLPNQLRAIEELEAIRT